MRSEEEIRARIVIAYNELIEDVEELLYGSQTQSEIAECYMWLQGDLRTIGELKWVLNEEE